MSKITRIILTLIVITTYVMVVVSMSASSLVGVLFLETFKESTNKELASGMYWWAIISLVGGIGVLMLSLFFYGPVIKWFVKASLVIPPVLFIVALFNVGAAFKSEVKLHVSDVDQRITYNQAVLPILESLLQKAPFIYATSCKKEDASTIYARCVMPTLYTSSQDPLTPVQLGVIENELRNLSEVKKQHPIDSRYFTSERGTEDIRVDIMSTAKLMKQRCGDPRNGFGSRNNYVCWVSLSNVTCDIVPVQSYVGFEEACP